MSFVLYLLLSLYSSSPPASLSFPCQSFISLFFCPPLFRQCFPVCPPPLSLPFDLLHNSTPSVPLSLSLSVSVSSSLSLSLPPSTIPAALSELMGPAQRLSSKSPQRCHWAVNQLNQPASPHTPWLPDTNHIVRMAGSAPVHSQTDPLQLRPLSQGTCRPPTHTPLTPDKENHPY